MGATIESDGENARLAGCCPRERIPPDVALERILSAADESCEWSQDNDGNWTTECGGMFVINEGTPKDNDMRFCCYCGKPLKTANADVTGLAPGKDDK